jgi:hypothetical protein
MGEKNFILNAKIKNKNAKFWKKRIFMNPLTQTTGQGAKHHSEKERFNDPSTTLD